MDIDEMKSNWQAAKNNINPGSENPDNNRKTALQRLADQYRRFSRLTLIVMLCLPLSLWNSGIKSIWLISGFVIVCGGASILDRYLNYSIRAIDPARMSVTEVLERTIRCRKLHLYWVAFAIPVVIFLCALMAYTLRAQPILIYACLTGGLIGLILGLFKLM